MHSYTSNGLYRQMLSYQVMQRIQYFLQRIDCTLNFSLTIPPHASCVVPLGLNSDTSSRTRQPPLSA